MSDKKLFNFDETSHKLLGFIGYCKTCETYTLLCPKCGNNICNAGQKCDLCKYVYEFYDKMLECGFNPKTGCFKKEKEEIKDE